MRKLGGRKVPTRTLLKVLAPALSLVAAASIMAQDRILDLPRNGRVVMALEAGPELMLPCSRNGQIRGVTGFWQPTDDELDDLELRLIAYIYARTAQHEEVPPAWPTYNRQYIGIERGDTRLIYGNYFSRGNQQNRGLSPNDPVNFCDGGPSLWGIIYDPDTGEFSELAFNGVT